MNPCLLIPIYNHGEEIGGVVSAVEPFGLPCLIVDDGSNEATRATLETLAARHPWVSVHRRPRNGGRGAALKTGYREALERGYTHAIQLDADGQHAATDVPAFLAAMEATPETLVLGAPQFDSSAPRSRLYGRQLSRVMVWLATLSFDVTDPLCGFRGIPLTATVALLDEVATGDHMEFDPQLIIRLHWAGVPVRNVPTRVVYRRGGLSHFDTVRDNVRLSGVYAAALGGALLRLPRRLAGRTAHGEPGRWEQLAEVGTARGLRFGAWFHRRFGRGPSTAGLVLTSAFYALRNGSARRGSRLYLERLAAFPGGRDALPRAPGFLLVIRHFHEFAITLYDRMVAWGGAIDTLELRHDGSERVLDLSRAGRGALLLSAHLGSLDVLGFIAQRYGLKFNVVAYYDNAERINVFFESLGTSQVRLIPIDPDSTRAVFDIRACLDRGEFVVILADRLLPGTRERSAEASFLGHPARFPLSPFLLGGVLGYPVHLLLCVRTGVAQYTSIVRPLAPAERPPRSERDKRARELLARYVALLEETCLRTPLQWFNFYDFWETKSK